MPWNVDSGGLNSLISGSEVNVRSNLQNCTFFIKSFVHVNSIDLYKFIEGPFFHLKLYLNAEFKIKSIHFLELWVFFKDEKGRKKELQSFILNLECRSCQLERRRFSMKNASVLMPLITEGKWMENPWKVTPFFFLGYFRVENLSSCFAFSKRKDGEFSFNFTRPRWPFISRVVRRAHGRRRNFPIAD